MLAQEVGNLLELPLAPDQAAHRGRQAVLGDGRGHAGQVVVQDRALELRSSLGSSPSSSRNRSRAPR